MNYRRTEAEFVKDWGNLRENADDALKLLGMLPNAIACKDEDHFLEEVTTRLSTALVCIDCSLGDKRPAILEQRDPSSSPEMSKTEAVMRAAVAENDDAIGELESAHEKLSELLENTPTDSTLQAVAGHVYRAAEASRRSSRVSWLLSAVEPAEQPESDEESVDPIVRADLRQVLLEARNGLHCLQLARDEVFAFVADSDDDDADIRRQHLSAIADGILPTLHALEAIVARSQRMIADLDLEEECNADAEPISGVEHSTRTGDLATTHAVAE